MFGGSQYYTLVAGLREYAAGAAPEKSFDADAVYGDVRRELSPRDRRAAGLVWALGGINGLPGERIAQLYAMCEASPCAYVRRWARFDHALRTAIAAHVGGRKVTDEEFDYTERLTAALGSSNIVEKERAIDAIRWDRAEAMVEQEGDTFGAPTLLAYLIKVAIVGRWAKLDPTTGREMYERLVSSLKDNDKN